jgi:hydrogenase expression/formation protein HypE
VSRDADAILLAHGSGGQLSHELVERVFARRFDNPILADLDDAAILAPDVPPGARLAFTTDSYVISPLTFPGGDIGKLAVCGTVNDLAVMGATPRYLSAGYILEEGLSIATLERIVSSMAETARAAGVLIVTGDTKVVDHGAADKVFINTAGIGVVAAGIDVGPARLRAGDQILVSGTMGDHGIAVMIEREGLRFSANLQSDCAPLHGLIARAMATSPGGVRCMRDPTRGGLVSTLVEWAGAAALGIEVDEAAVPLRETVRAACELLGLDPLYVANEGKVVLAVDPAQAAQVLSALRAHPLGREAAVIGRVTAAHPGRVVLRTPLGAHRLLDMLAGEQLPRIC